MALVARLLGIVGVDVRRAMLLAVATALGLSAAACTHRSDLPRGAAAYSVIPADDPGATIPDYIIGPLDRIDISVFQEPELSVANVQIDASGTLALPLIGSVQAAGKTANMLADDISARLAAQYLENPQVTVRIAASVSQRITVQGSVTEPGIYPISGRTTLLDAIALARGTTRTAALDEVIVFRTINGERNAAVFNIRQIERGEADDPSLQGDDTVVVGFSGLKSAWRDFLSTVPLIAIFRPFR